VFRRSSDPAPASDAVPDGADGASGKGRPTPKRKEAEAARRQKAAPPRDRREAKARMKSERAKERQRSMDALRSGDERLYPVRDQGKARHIARNWVDGRRNFGEIFWPVVITALVMLFLPVPALQQASTVVLLGFYILITADSAWSLFGLRRTLHREVPDAGDRRGALAYAFGRSIQSRKRRMPIPKVERGWTRKYTKGETDAVAR
jgi:Protein of unknown function (DUF3043)